MNHTFHPGQAVRAVGRPGVGYITRHHPNLPAWVVRFDGDVYPLAYTDDRLRGVA